MNIVFDIYRGLHLLLLITLTYTFGKVLIDIYEWTPLSAYGLTCSLVCQLSNVFLKVREMTNGLGQYNESDRGDEDRRTRRKMSRKAKRQTIR
jgi:hypothetical protein